MIFQRAIRREFAHTAGGVFVALFAILITMVLIRLLGQAAGGKLPVDAVLALIGFGALAQLPVVLSLTVFVAVLLSLSRCYRDSEMVVWFASGLPLTAFIRPVVQFAAPLVLVIAAMTLLITPWANMQSEAFRAALESRDDSTRVAPGIFRESAGQQRVFFVERGADDEDKLRNVFVSSEEGGALAVIASAQGTISVDERGDRFVVLEHGRRYDGQPGTSEYRVLEFERYAILIEERAVASPTVRTKATSTADLLDSRSSRQMGELVGRISLPVAALLLALMAIPLSFVNPRAGRGNNLIFAILAYLLYSNVIGVSEAWVSQDRLRFELAVLLPHLFVLSLLAIMFYRRLVVSPFWRARG